ncbi:F-box/kelch-repeat protein [Corchorus capsularis]|uniref:F-box/kelch-repeat protein n=1 Tax=Corchorus capsularis TaxID=210143 RepID=A0A1R3HMX2_COCAP|nr:F-box/kelch-repeat protein [Corchorus capsularis]
MAPLKHKIIIKELRLLKPTDSSYSGPLGGDTPPLPRDAWDKWCKHGSVICFAVEAARPEKYGIPIFSRLPHDMLKIYFGNPMDGSIYHVIDFDYYEFGRNPYEDSKVGFILVGSRIYVLGGIYHRRSGPVDVYYCDVAAAAANGNNKWEWVRGPDLNSFKAGNPFVFSLMGNIYVHATACRVLYDAATPPEGEEIADCRPFEVLRDDIGKWEVLESPFSECGCNIHIGRSFVYGDKILIQCYQGPLSVVYIYDAKRGLWLRTITPFNYFKLSWIFNVDRVVDLGLLIGKTDEFLGLHVYDGCFELQGVVGHLGLSSALLMKGTVEEGTVCTAWHLFPLGLGGGQTQKYCFLAMYSFDDHRCPPKASHVRLGTFDLEPIDCDADGDGHAGFDYQHHTRKLRSHMYDDFQFSDAEKYFEDEKMTGFTTSWSVPDLPSRYRVTNEAIKKICLAPADKAVCLARFCSRG